MRITAENRERGVTLIELIVVLVILIGLAGLAITAVTSVAADSREDTTRVTLTTLRNVIQSTYKLDLGAPPAVVADLLRAPVGATPYDPETRRGWRGPYVLVPNGRYIVDLAQNFELIYGADGDLGVHDGYGRPLVLQYPDPDADSLVSPEEVRHARLVSAGSDGRLDTPRTAYFPTLAACGDDLVLYVAVADQRP